MICMKAQQIPTARRHILNSASDRFEHIVLIASDDLYVEFIADQGRRSRPRFLAIRSTRFATLAISVSNRWPSNGWLRAGVTLTVRSSRAQSYSNCASRWSHILGLAGLPHTPWLLVVILEQTEGSDTPEVAARNGNYGHLYHAVITVALSQSQMTQFDLSGEVHIFG